MQKDINYPITRRHHFSTSKFTIQIKVKVDRYKVILYKHQWRNRWAFAGKHDIVSSHAKITCYFHMWKDQRCYGYIISRDFCSKKIFKWNGLDFLWCIYNKKNITRPLGETKFLFSCSKICHSFAAFTRSKRNFVSPRGHVISSIGFKTNKYK